MDDMSKEQAAAAAALFNPSRIEMIARLSGALELTDALRDLVPVVIAAGQSHDETSASQIADATPAGRRLDPEVRSRLQDLARAWEAATDSAIAAHPADESAVAALDAAAVAADPFGALNAMIDVSALIASVVPAFLEAGFASIDELQYTSSYLQASMRSARTPLLLSALFVTSVSTLEALVTRMVHLLLHHTDPATYPSLSDPALDARARRLCFGPVGMWRDLLVDHFGIDVLANTVDWDSLVAYWEDRNALIHRGGIVDARHSAKSGADVGTVLNPTRDEVEDAIDTVGAARYAIVAAVWDRIEPGIGAELAGLIGQTVWESQQASRWRQAEGIARVQEAFAPDADTAARAAVNRWLAIEHLKGPEAIRAEVRAWDPAGLSGEFQMARHVLLHEDEQALHLLRTLLSEGVVEADHLELWPLLARLRESGLLDGINSPPTGSPGT